MTYPSRRGGAGAGFRLGPETNEFADTTARDAFFASSLANLAEYDANEFLLVRVGTGGGPFTYFQRNNDAWASVDPVLTGPSGEVASLSGVSVGHVPYKLPDGTFGDSGAQVLSNGDLLAPEGFGVEAASVDFGDVVRLSEANSFMRISNNQFPDVRFDIIDARTRRAGASDRPRQFYQLEAENELVVQSGDGTAITSGPVTFTLPVTANRQINSVISRASATMDNVRARIRYTTGAQTVVKYWPTKARWLSGNGEDLTPDGNSEIAIEFDQTPFRVITGDVYEVEIRADNYALLGNGSGVPYVAIMQQESEFRDVAWLSDVMGQAFNVPEITAFDIPAVANKNHPAPFALSGAQVFTYNITNQVNIASAVIEQGGTTIKTLTPSEISAGTASATISAINLSAGESETFTLKVVDTNTTPETHTRNVVIRSPQEHEFAYVGDETTTAQFSVSTLDTYTAYDVTSAGGTFQFQEQVPDTQFLGILVPQNRDIVTILDDATGQDATSEFTKETGVRTIGSQNYNLYTLQNNSGFAGTFSLTVTVGG